MAPVIPTIQPSQVTPGLFCDPAKLSLKIDTQQPVPWPRKVSLKIEGLDLTQSHLVVAMCRAKPLQSFRFKFYDCGTGELCLTFEEYMFDGYQGMRLWESKHAPWCKCK